MSESNESSPSAGAKPRWNIWIDGEVAPGEFASMARCSDPLVAKRLERALASLGYSVKIREAL